MTKIFYWVSKGKSKDKGNMVVGTEDQKFMVAKTWDAHDKMTIKFKPLPFENYTDGMTKTELKKGSLVHAYHLHCIELMFPERKKTDEKVFKQPKTNF